MIESIHIEPQDIALGRLKPADEVLANCVNDYHLHSSRASV